MYIIDLDIFSTFINNNKITRVIQIDQNIPVIITGIKYNIGNNKISASAYPLSPDLWITLKLVV